MAQVKQDLRERIKEHYRRCSIDPIFFIRKYCYIQHPTKGRFLFDLYPYQEQAILDLEKNDRVIVLKGRQLGLTTALSCYALWITLFHRDKNVVVVATMKDTAQQIITKAKFAYDNLPVWLRTTVTAKNTTKLTFANGSVIEAVSSSDGSIRSKAVSLLIIDEAAHIDNAENIWTSAAPSLSTGGRGVLISSPLGVGNFFHRTWEDSELGINEFFKIKLTWRDHPDRGEEWYEKERKNYTPRAWDQEHEAAFLGSGNTVFDAFVIEDYRKKYVLPPIQKTGIDGNVWIFEHPKVDVPYLIAADSARGDGEDFSAFHIINALTLEQVAEYKGKIDTGLFAGLLVAYASMYGQALLIVELNNHGHSVLQKIIDMGYKNIFYNTDTPDIVEENRQMTNKLSALERKKTPGFLTSKKSRPLIVAKLEDYISLDEETNVKMHSSRF